MTAQEAKEEAVLLAVQQGFGLVRQGNLVVAIYADGTKLRISESHRHETLWHDALAVLKRVEARRPRRRDRIFGAVMDWFTR